MHTFVNNYALRNVIYIPGNMNSPDSRIEMPFRFMSGVEICHVKFLLFDRHNKAVFYVINNQLSLKQNCCNNDLKMNTFLCSDRLGKLVHFT